MPHVHEVLSEKEISIDRLRREIDALRLVCDMLHEEGDADPTAFELAIEQSEGEGTTESIPLADEKEASLARIRVRFIDGQENNVTTNTEPSVPLDSSHSTPGDSRSFLKRVLDIRFLEREPQRKAIRDLFQRFGRSNAA